MSDFNPYTFHTDGIYLDRIMQPFSIKFNAMKHLFEYINTEPQVRYCFVTGYVDFAHPLITLEATLMDRIVENA